MICVAPAELLDVLRTAVETRKTQLVDAALDCVQRLISHGLLTGPVQSINHRREAASKAAGARKKQGDEDDEADPAAQGPMPPQVLLPSCVPALCLQPGSCCCLQAGHALVCCPYTDTGVVLPEHDRPIIQGYSMVIRSLFYIDSNLLYMLFRLRRPPHGVGF